MASMAPVAPIMTPMAATAAAAAAAATGASAVSTPMAQAQMTPMPNMARPQLPSLRLLQASSGSSGSAAQNVPLRREVLYSHISTYNCWLFLDFSAMCWQTTPPPGETVMYVSLQSRGSFLTSAMAPLTPIKVSGL